MKVYQYNFSISAESEAEADEKIRALTILAQKLKTNEVVKLAQFVKDDPAKTAIAKKYLGL